MPLSSIEDIKEHIAPRLRSVIRSIAEEIAQKNTSVSCKLYEDILAPRLYSQIGVFLKPEAVSREVREEVLFYAACRWEPGSLECWVTIGGEADLEGVDTQGPRSRIALDENPDSVKDELDRWVTSATQFIRMHKDAVVSHLAT
jgi:hypothetical protein